MEYQVWLNFRGGFIVNVTSAKIAIFGQYFKKTRSSVVCMKMYINV